MYSVGPHHFNMYMHMHLSIDMCIDTLTYCCILFGVVVFRSSNGLSHETAQAYQTALVLPTRKSSRRIFMRIAKSLQKKEVVRVGKRVGRRAGRSLGRRLPKQGGGWM